MFLSSVKLRQFNSVRMISHQLFVVTMLDSRNIGDLKDHRGFGSKTPFQNLSMYKTLI